jgi:hypothetical protein
MGDNRVDIRVVREGMGRRRRGCRSINRALGRRQDCGMAVALRRRARVVQSDEVLLWILYSWESFMVWRWRLGIYQIPLSYIRPTKF